MIFRPVLLMNLLFPGMLIAADIELVRDLYSDGLWTECRTEAGRVLAVEPENLEIRFYLAESKKNLGIEALEIFASLGADPSAPPSIRYRARYEEALILWRNGEHAAAAEALRDVFLHTQNGDLFVKAGCALSLALRSHPMPWGGARGIGPQLRSSAPVWAPELTRSMKHEMAEPRSFGFDPGRYLISFYRSQIRPAIGERCTLHPSCSEYSKQAFAKHGFLLGLFMTADRFIREPGIVSAADQPILKGGRIFFMDPVSDHDWWFHAPETPGSKHEK